MMFKFQPNGLVVLRATLIIKSVAVLAMLLVALLLQDRHGQAVMLWPVVVVLLLLVVFGTNWFETRLGVYFSPWPWRRLSHCKRSNSPSAAQSSPPIR
ncbi:MAG: hypothetical protein HZY76_07365 [Anaerolineae bacterium]|nr:MAG: hypothetical protein HZY76_07365 [Anaerolineae bacterium]